MKKSCGLLLVSSLFLSLMAGVASSFKNSIAVFAWGGEGTSDEPYQISTLDDFNKFRNIVNGTGGETKNTAACAILTADIDLNNTYDDKTVQLGSESSPYNGTFDGNGYTISNLYIDTETQDTVGGLFKYTTASAIIKNFSITGTVKSKKPSAVVGVNKGTIAHVTNRADITVNNCNTDYTNYRAGGIAAENAGGTISYCNNYGTIYSFNYGGGIVGKAYLGETSNYGHIDHCVNYGLVSKSPDGYTWSAYFIGGIAGISFGNYIVECIHAGEVYGQLYIAGILGQMSDIDKDTHPHIIDRCLSIGTVQGEYPSSTYSDGIGAILGKVEKGNIIDNDPDDAKFLYRNYYLKGSVTYESGAAVVNNCGYGETNSTNIGTGHRDVAGQAQGLTADQIKVKSNFNNWTFGDFYEMGKDYPVTSDVAVNQAIELINNIGTVEYTNACKEKIDVAERVYDGLSQEHKAEISNSSVLEAALVTYAELKEKHDAADAVVDLINAIGTVEYTDESKEKIDEARAAYDNLTEEQKELVPDASVEKLEQAEERYAALEEAQKHKPFPGWAIALIIIGGIILLAAIAYVLLFFVLNKWIKIGDKAVRAFKLFGLKKDGKPLVWGFPFKFVTREESEIFKTKEDALK